MQLNNRIFIALALSLSFVVTACGNNNKWLPKEVTQGSDPSASAWKQVSDILLHPENISVHYNQFVYCPTNEEQFQQVSDLLSEIDFSLLEKDTETDQVFIKTAAPFAFLFEKAGRSYRVNIVLDEEPSGFAYLYFGNYRPDENITELTQPKRETEEILFRGPAHAMVDFKEFYDVYRSILVDNTDLENCAEITVLSVISPNNLNAPPSPGTTYQAMKGNTAMLKHFFDSMGSPYPASANPVKPEDCDLKIVIGDTTYLYDTATGAYLINGIQAFALEGQWQTELRIHLY